VLKTSSHKINSVKTPAITSTWTHFLQQGRQRHDSTYTLRSVNLTKALYLPPPPWKWTLPTFVTNTSLLFAYHNILMRLFCPSSWLPPFVCPLFSLPPLHQGVEEAIGGGAAWHTGCAFRAAVYSHVIACQTWSIYSESFWPSVSWVNMVFWGP